MGTTVEKATKAIQSISEIQQGINNLGGSLTDQTPLDEFRAELDDIYAKFPKTSYAEGSNITLENCLKGKLDYEDDKVGYGDTEQEGEPTPTTPIPIQVVTGEQEVVVRGINMFAEIENQTLNGMTLTKTDNGYILNGTTTANTTFRGTLTTFVNSNKTLVAKCDTDITNANIQVKTRNASGTQLRSISLGNKNIWVVSSGEYEDVMCDIYIKSGVTLNNALIQPMLLGGTYIASEVPNYEPYITPITKQLSLGDKELFEDSYISKENGNWYFNDNWKRVTLNGTENWIYNVNSAIHHRLIVSDANFTTSNNEKTNVMTTRFAQGIWNNSSDNQVVTSLSASTTLGIVCNTYTSKDAFKTFLSSNNTDVVYPLAETIKTPITNTTLINQLEDIWSMQSVNGTTIVEINGNLPMIMKVRALSK